MSVRIATGAKADWALGTGTVYVNIPEIRKWDLTVSNATKEYASSSTAGAKQRIAGAEDAKVTMDAYIDRSTAGASLDSMGIKAGAAGKLKLWEDNTYFWIVPVYVDDVAYHADIEGGNIVDGTISASRNGAITYPVL